MLERFNMAPDFSDMNQCGNGDWVRYADAQATIADLQGQHDQDVRYLRAQYDSIVEIKDKIEAERTALQQRVAQLEEYRQAYEEAMKASNAAGYVGFTAAQTINDLQADHARVLKLVQALPYVEGEIVIDEESGPKPYRLSPTGITFGSRVNAETYAALLRYRASLPAQPAQGGAAGNTEQALDFAVRALRSAQPIVCSASCPSVKRTGEEWTHRQPCDSLTLTLRTLESYLPKKGEHVCGARGFGQSLDDQCPGCEHDKLAALTPQGDGRDADTRKDSGVDAQVDDSGLTNVPTYQKTVVEPAQRLADLITQIMSQGGGQ